MKELDHEYPLKWFNSEFKNMTKVDIYEEVFDKNSKYKIIETPNLSILIMRIDLADERMLELLNAFLGVSMPSFVNMNISMNKEYAELYERFKRQISLPKQYIERMLGSKYSKHFYSPRELDELADKYMFT